MKQSLGTEVKPLNRLGWQWRQVGTQLKLGVNEKGASAHAINISFSQAFRIFRNCSAPDSPRSNQVAISNWAWVLRGCVLPLIMLSHNLYGGESGIIAAGARLEKLAGDFSFTEGPACDANGNVFFTDQPNDRIMEWSTDGKLSTYKQPCGRANGLSFDKEGNLWACADEKNELWWIAPDGKVTVAVKDYHGHLLNGPNDVWIRPQGGLYFSDPFYKRPYWKRGAKEQDCEGVYYLAKDGQTLTRVVSDLQRPNGIIGTPHGKWLYVADIDGKKTYRYDIQRDGSLRNKTFFCDMGSDGMTIDNKGNIYLTGDGVSVFDPGGKKIEHVAVGEPWTANVCFGGKDRHTLFITASKGFYGLKMKVKGVDSQ